MEQYPSELTSPPVPLVALIGKPELHPALGDFLRSQNVPRVHSIGIPDAHSTAGTFGAQAMATLLHGEWQLLVNTTRSCLATLSLQPLSLCCGSGIGRRRRLML
jgi:hypothetical protein